MILNFQSIQSYVIDVFTIHAASGPSCPMYSIRVSSLTWDSQLWRRHCASARLQALGSRFLRPLCTRAMVREGGTILAVVVIVIGCPASVALTFFLV